MTSVVLVFIYLYLTPCRCFCCPKNNHQDSFHSSMLSHEDLANNTDPRHVAFIDPKELGQNGKVNPSDMEGDQGEMDEEGGLLGNGRRKKSVAESISLVFSDTPIVV